VTLATLVAVALAYRVSIRSLLRGAPLEADSAFRRVASGQLRPFAMAVPLYSLKAAAGRFGASSRSSQKVGFFRSAGRAPARGLSSRRSSRLDAAAHSERAYCLFRHPVLGSRNGRVVLAQHRQITTRITADVHGEGLSRTETATRARKADGPWK